MTAIQIQNRELQMTLLQLEAELRRLASTVHTLSECLSHVPASLSTPQASPLPDILPAVPGPRRGTSRPASAFPVQTAGNGQWRLREGGWTLVSPQGTQLALTTLERRFLLALFAAPDRGLARTELGTLEPARGESGQQLLPSPRGIDVMVSRLRRKAQAAGMPLPLRSVRRWGYMFADAAVVD